MRLDRKTTKALVEHWFYIPQSINEQSIYYVIFQKFTQSRPRLGMNRKNMFTIFTTMACNARCPYCYEQGAPTVSMSKETALDTAKYVDCNRMHNTKVHLKWFGGEPLLNGDAINIICEYMKNVGVDFYSTITSNGYLFDQYTDEEIIQKWNLKRAQITLDGTKNTYQNIKRYVNGDNYAFEKVIKNIHRLTDLGINVHIRMNISQDNGEDLLSLVDYLKTQFDKNKYLKIYSYILFNDENSTMTNEQRKIACDYYRKIEEKIVNSGFGIYGFKFPTVCINHCMADNGTSVCITPIGNLTPCEHHSDDEIIGTIYDGITNYSVVNSWTERLSEPEKCSACKFHPQCITLKKCPSFSKGCDDFLRLRKEISAKFAMDNAYTKYLNEVNGHEKSNKPSECRSRIHGEANT